MSHLSVLAAGGEAGVGAGSTEHFALFEAIRNGRFRQAKLLVEGGADVNGRNARGETLLTTACVHVEDARARARFTRLLLDAHADPNSCDAHGMTPLMHASMLGLNEVVLVLLDYATTDVLLQDSLGNTALMYAAAFGHENIVRTLLTSGAKGSPLTILRQTNFLGQTAFNQAARANHTHIVALMKSFDAPPIERAAPPNPPYNTPLSTPEIHRSPQELEIHEQETQVEAASAIEEFPHLNVEPESSGTLPDVSQDSNMNETRRNSTALFVSRDVQNVIAQEEMANPHSRPPTPARPMPHLPTLKNRQGLDLNASTRSEPGFSTEASHGRAQQQLTNVSWISLSRSISEPQTLGLIANNLQKRENFDDYDETVDPLAASTKSDPGLITAQMTRNDKDGNCVHLPPIRNTALQKTVGKGLIPIVENMAGKKLLNVDVKPARRRSLKRRNEDSNSKIPALKPNEKHKNHD